MPTRRWVIQYQGEGSYAVLRNGRQLVCDYGLRAAERYVGRKRVGDEPVYIEAPDGNRRNITSHF